MHVHRLSSYSAAPDWRYSLRFFLLAAALHIGVLFAPFDLLKSARTEPEAITVRLTSPAPQAPVPTPVVEPVAPPPPKTVRPAKSPTPVRPVLAVAPEPTAPTPEFRVAAPPDIPAPAAAPVERAQPVVSAARFDAAYLNNPPPDYPRLSRQLGEEGKVLLKVRVRADGTAAAVDLEKSSNFARLDEAARRAVTRWRFVPARRGDEAVEASVIVPIVFRLDS